MENRKVGLLIIGIAIIMSLIVIVFNLALRDIVSETCSHGPSCSMYGTIATQTLVSLIIVLVIFIIGLFIMFTKPEERIVIQKVKEKVRKKKLDLSKLEKDERKVIELLIKEGNAMFQADLKEKLDIGKVKMTRLLDKLEAKQFIERKRRGMNNIVVLKH